ncbi:DUF3819 domain-containing protein, partial [archaeon]
ANVAWLASRLVQRAASEPKNQPSYLALLFAFDNRALEREVLRQSVETVKNLLASMAARDRATYKNWGAWIGKLTLARNKPVLQEDMDLKSMLLEAYEAGRLLAVVPFVAKLLEGAASSTVFRPPNPWTMSLLAVFHELWEVQNLKMMLKYELELVSKALAVDWRDIPMKNLLHRRRRPNLTNNQDFNVQAAANPDTVPGVATPPTPPPGSVGGAGGVGVPGGNNSISGPTLLPGLRNLVTLRAFGAFKIPAVAASLLTMPDPSALLEKPEYDAGAEVDEPNSSEANLRSVVAHAIDRAVRELLMPVVERSVTIAVSTTRELVTKDMAQEGDAERV